jgi:hypothetical protein
MCTEALVGEGVQVIGRARRAQVVQGGREGEVRGNIHIIITTMVGIETGIEGTGTETGD